MSIRNSDVRKLTRVLNTFDYWVRKEAFSVSEYLTWMSLIDSIPEKCKVAVKATNDVTDYGINVDFAQLLTTKKYTKFSLKSIIPPTAKKLI